MSGSSSANKFISDLSKVDDHFTKSVGSKEVENLVAWGNNGGIEFTELFFKTYNRGLLNVSEAMNLRNQIYELRKRGKPHKNK